MESLAVYFFFKCWYLGILRITIFGTYQGTSTFMHRAFDWKCSRISVLVGSGSCTPELYFVSQDWFE
jgi:hypothetical protein